MDYSKLAKEGSYEHPNESSVSTEEEFPQQMSDK